MSVYVCVCMHMHVYLFSQCLPVHVCIVCVCMWRAEENFVTSLTLELKAHAAMSDIVLTWVLRVELGTLCLQHKHSAKGAVSTELKGRFQQHRRSDRTAVGIRITVLPPASHNSLFIISN